MGTPTRTAKLGLLGAVVAALIAASGGVASADATCNKVASPSGSDAAAGTAAAPYRTALRLVGSLSSGQTGCLRAGTYVESIDVRTPSTTLTSYPGERATLRGRLYVAASASGTTISSLNLDGRSENPDAEGETIDADNVTVSGNDITNYNTAICLGVGNASYGRAHNLVIENNNIHNCGKLPAANHDHGIYLEDADGTVVRNNWIHDNADRGIQFFPNADNSVITGNVIDSNGQGIIFSGEFVNGRYETSDNNLVEHNVITNSLVRHNVESAYPGGMPFGSNNVVQDNCIAGANGWYEEADGSGIQSPQEGFVASNNLVADPNYVDPATRDYHLRSSSPCASILTGGDVDPSSGPVNDPTPPPPTSTPPTSTPPTSTPPATSPPKKPPKKKRRRHAHRARAHGRHA
jgi:hypothetical protein